MADNVIRSEVVKFPNQNEALALFPAAEAGAGELVAALGLKPYKAVILVIGGADGLDEKLLPRLTQLFGRGIARAAAEAGALLVDGGTRAGVMSLTGEGVAGRGYKSELIGVAPAGKVKPPGGDPEGAELEPNHSHFVLVGGEAWGDETDTMFDLVAALTGHAPPAKGRRREAARADAGKPPAEVPGLAILAAGGETSRGEVLRVVRQNLPLIVVEGSGGLADEIAAAWRKREAPPDDPFMAEVVADGEIHLHPLGSAVKGVERLIIRELDVDKVLMQAWEVFADYDLNANLQQKRFGALQLSILLLGLFGTALAIIKAVYAPEVRDASGNVLPPAGAWWVVYHLLIITPILLTVLITAANRFRQGSKWLLLRAGAESIKREIYRYRARAMDYEKDPEQQLSKRIEDITRRTMRTEVNLSALVPYDKERGFPPYMYAAGGGDDGFSYLTPDRYVEVRLGDQLRYFRRKSVKLERQLKALYWLTFVVGGVGTYLAATGRQVWIALTTAVVVAVGTYLGYRQTESTLMKYNQAATDLSNVRAWWDGLSAEQQSEQENINSLVAHTEQVLQSELDGWVQQMQNALAELRKGQEPAPTPERKENREPREQGATTGKQPPAGADATNGKAGARRPAADGGRADEPSAAAAPKTQTEST